MTVRAALPPAWTCPFCPLACDHVGVRVNGDATPLALFGATCGRAEQGLLGFAGRPSDAAASVDGATSPLEAALAEAARRLGASRQPLFAGLGTDVDGARALYPLACATGAICDAAGGEALMQGLRALQDRGQFTTTLAEVRTRADLIVFVGGLPTAQAPLIAARLGIGDRQVAQRHVVVLGPAPADHETLRRWAGDGVSVEAIALQGDLFSTLGALAALSAGHRLASADEALEALVGRLQRARYGVFVGAPARLPAQGALLVEAVHRIVGSLNRRTRAAALWIGGGSGAGTANQVFTWLSGLPLRSRLGPHGLEHEPLRFDTARLLADGAVDALLWVSSFEAAATPPPAAVPTIVLGHPAQAEACCRRGVIFIPVATPGIGTPGHLFRTDGSVLMPLTPVRGETLPTVGAVARRLLQSLQPELRS